MGGRSGAGGSGGGERVMRGVRGEGEDVGEAERVGG